MEIPVVYDGPDLADVAAAWGVTAADVPRIHAGTEFRVAFCGFAPGFGYLTGLPEHLHMPRRATPRTRVPAGALALAGPYTGVYPRPSPGGWQIIGRMPEPGDLWNPAREPAALLSPGARVRFVAAEVRRMTGAIEVVRAGALTTVQDAGRIGWAHLGVPRAGALDAPSHRLANRLAGNPADAATAGDDRYRLRGPRRTGRWSPSSAVRPAAVTVDGRPVAWGAPVHVPAGAVLDAGPAVQGLRSYLALRAAVCCRNRCWAAGPPTCSPGSARPRCATGTYCPWAAGAPTARGRRRRALAGRARANSFSRYASAPATPGSRMRRCARSPTATYRVSPHSNRIGLRTEGPALARAHEGELPSEGMVLGAIQVPPDGRPVVFLNDHPTTGGYPVVGVVRRDRTRGGGTGGARHPGAVRGAG